MLGLCMIGVGFSRSVVLTGGLLWIGGSAWMLSMAVCNITVQTSCPRWVTGRALAAFQTSLCAGIAIGSWGWGAVATAYGTDVALIASGIAMLGTMAARFVLPMPKLDDAIDHGLVDMRDPETRMELTGRSGPIVLTIEYRVEPDKARAFYGVMQHVQKQRQRTGGYGWSISRDIGDPALWTERYHVPTWHDYLRQRSRATVAELEILNRAFAFHTGEGRPTVHRNLERPFGSVRWSDDAPDRGVSDIISVTPAAGTGG